MRLIREGVDGLLCEAGDVAALASRMAQLIGEPALGRTLADVGARKARAEFAWPRIYGRMEGIYRLAEERVAKGGSLPSLPTEE